MYKKRIAEWGIEKNVKSEEMQAILRKRIQRASKGKRSIFLLRDTKVPEEKIERFRKRKSLSDEQILRIAARTPPALKVYTPPGSPLALALEHEIPERVAKAVQDLCYGMFDSGVWMVDGAEEQEIISECDLNMLAVSDFRDDCEHASQLFNISKSRQAWRILNIASARVQQIVKNDGVYTLPRLASVLLKGSNEGGLDDMIRKSLLRFLFNMYAKLRSYNYPMTKICEFLLQSDDPQWNYIRCIALRCQSECLSQLSSRFSLTVIQIRLHMMERSHSVDPEQQIKNYTAFLSECERALGPSDVRTIYVRHSLALAYREQGDAWKAIETHQCTIALISERSSSRSLMDALRNSYRNMAYAYDELDDVNAAAYYLRKGIELSADLYGWEDSVVLRGMAELAELLREWDRSEEADEWDRKTELVLQREYAELERQENEEWARYEAQEASKGQQRTE